MNLDILGPNTRLLQVASFCFVIWMWVWGGLVLFEPAWYARLGNNFRKKNYVVGLIIGLAFKVLTIPSCVLAAYMTAPEDDVAGIHGPMNNYQQTCWGSRGTTVMIEFYHYIGNTELLVHHGLIVLLMTLITVYNGPHRGLDLSLGALVSEWPSMTFSIIRELGLLGQYPDLEWALLVAGAGLTLAIRVPAIFIGMAMLPASGLRGGPGRVVLVAYAFYLVYNLNISWRRLRKARIWLTWQTENGGWDFGIRLSGRFIVSSTAFFAGLATLSIMVLGLAILSMFTFATKDRLTYATGLFVIALLWAVQVLQRDERCHRGLAGLAQQLASIEMPTLGTVSKWTVGLWVLYIFRLALVGETPESHNKHLDPMDVTAQSPLLCELILTWYFWLCATIALLLPMFMVGEQSYTHSSGTGKERVLGGDRE